MKKDFKNKVLEWIKSEGIDIGDKRVRVYNSPRYGLEVRIYNEPMEMVNSRSSFRRTEAVHNETGKITGYNGTRGVHSKKISTYTYIDEKDFASNKEERDFIIDVLKEGLHEKHNK